ncbi:DUF1223 domain-containing protein [Ponticoccus sp. SC2-23]|uniref:DUF1223 domain-containing protein n=1 Tax=Alexandriicola marinus TaxID=2081710 RepID=UPI000FD9AB5E|nr:DUF1223 domain-containing protein [Alexandriicola marinus]MBM1222371.1 DUF1223 domain-containing protein [Ponticoccus sp. SC6-9]MBM1224484.1 DUF1223 domain-containing protein [Ponticoccus sp. SC6-15]MBM1229736.1 DUF1223 domain-containing protein [Ponticoccus sp. SC6-38]MBM1233450.1 DUF1223 domain-containing protein [Ponticoccus sp. SC6-45]MBM1236600.1 DUF1223 domain-containing protein [Ponticoccus sp. SC6-49]MBM1244644.1 DUF1223 domain-containing protein [Ponticoccus sp. SC2-64]MBM1246974
MRAFCAALLSSICLALPATAQDNPVVVELFTSQGCSSCPPADAMLQELASRDDVIALALHVDYWDYIGWKDIYASPEFTERQHGYARAAGERTVYTPQFIIGGRDHVIGANGMAVMDLIRSQEQEPDAVTLSIVASDGGFSLEARSTARGDMVVQLVRYIPDSRVEILRGENRGRTLSHSNVVTDWDVIARWDGADTLRLSAELSGSQPSVVIVQEDGNGPILAAARIE